MDDDERGAEDVEQGQEGDDGEVPEEGTSGEPKKVALEKDFVVAEVIVEVPRIVMDPDEIVEEPTPSRRSTRSASKKATQSIHETVARRPSVDNSPLIEDSDDHDNDITVVEATPVKRKRGRPRKVPRMDEAETKRLRVSVPPFSSHAEENKKAPTIYRIKDGKLVSSAIACSSTVTPAAAAHRQKPNGNAVQSQQDLGLYEKIGVHIRKAGISSSYCLKKLDDDSVVTKVMEILRPRSGLHSSYDVVTALVRLGVLCVDDPILPSRNNNNNQDESTLIKNLLEQLHQGPSSAPDNSNDDVVVIGESESVSCDVKPSSSEMDSASGELAFNSVLKSIPAKRGKCTFAGLNEAVWKFFVGCADAGVKLNGRILRQRAFSIAKRMDLTTFRASEGWLNAFKYRHKIDFGRMTGSPYDYSNGFEADLESVNSDTRTYNEPTVREVVTNASNLNMSAKSFLLNQTDHFTPETNGEAVSKISANQYVQQIAASKARASVSSEQSANEDVMEVPVEESPPPADTPPIPAVEEVDPGSSTIQSLVRSCVFTVPDERVQAAVDTLRSYILTSNNLDLLKPLSKIQETLAKAAPISQPSVVKTVAAPTPTIASVLAEQVPLQNPVGTSRMLIRRTLPTRTPIKFPEGRTSNIKLFPKVHYQPTLPDDPTKTHCQPSFPDDSTE
ncbi:hypothetical protein QR680_013467 [Steinernema hermaphroditum]|uniref:HTH CENPB-type domain-containing protein n=1 Tax=Steinernema hermaphroditum TaxID=289476 RepID=A0AA39I5L6_9BILA|nr:hypothetical protein QR680_013467 [Steinernema hermaphroditum]